MGAIEASSNVYNQGLNFVRENVTALVVLSATPANLAACTAATVLARVTGLTSLNFALSSDTTLGGYKITVSSFATSPVISTGNATVVALYSTAGASGTTGLHYYTKCSLNLGSTSNSVSIQSWSITILAPTT